MAEAAGRRGPFVNAIDGLATLGIGCLVVAIVLTCADIVWRRVVGGAFVDTVDLTKLCLVAAASLSIPYGFVHSTHVTVDLLADRLPAVPRALLDLATAVAAAIFLAFLWWLALDSALQAVDYGDTTLNLRLPMIWYWALFLFGLALAVLAALWQAASAIGRLRAGARPPPAAGAIL